MTIEELKKEAEEYATHNDWFEFSANVDKIGNAIRTKMERAYIASAEPREKQIAELERKLKVETELSNRLGLAYREYEELTKEQDEHLAELEKENAELKNKLEHRNCLDCSNHSSKLRMKTLELEKENAELKGIKDVATLIRANNDTVTTLMQLNNMLVSKTQQLTKAKDHIKKLLDCLKQDTNDPQTNYYVCQYMDKAEQFLSEVEK